MKYSDQGHVSSGYILEQMEWNVEKGAGNPDPDQILEQVNRITGSSGFAGSESLRSVLLYLSRHAIEHPGKTVKEYEIATQALGRSQDFDSRIDSAVRAIASRLRSKLAEYYLHEGMNDPIVIDLPKGSYALSFFFRERATPLQQQATPFIEEKSTASSRPHFLPLLWCAIAVVVVGGLGYMVGHHSPATPVPEPTRTFWEGFLRGGDPLIVFPNPTFRGLPETGMQLVEPDSPNTPGTIDLLTGTGETMAVAALTRQLLQLGHDSRVKRVHLFTWDDAANTNLIFLGGQMQNAAFAQLPKLERFSLKPPEESPFSGQGAVHDDRPAPGGESYYLASKDFNNGNDFAIIALTEGATSEHQILILAGSNTYGTEGAANFLCNPDSVKGLLEKLGVKEDSPLPPFEALLRVPERGGTPISPQLVIVYKRQPDASQSHPPHP